MNVYETTSWRPDSATNNSMSVSFEEPCTLSRDGRPSQLPGESLVVFVKGDDLSISHTPEGDRARWLTVHARRSR